MSRARALVTGAAGFIGSHLVARLVRNGLEVHALCRPRGSLARLAPVRARITVHAAALDDARAVRRAVRRAAPDVVCHLAAATMHGGVVPDASTQVRTNLLGTMALVDACTERDVRLFIHTADGFEQRAPMFYGLVRLAATRYARQAARDHGRAMAALRLCSVYGPGDDPRRLVPRVIAHATAGDPIPLSHPRVARDFVYVEDVVDAYVALLRSRRPPLGEVLDVGSGAATTIAAIVARILALTGARCELRWGAYPTAPHDHQRPVANVARTRRLLRWTPRTTLAAGLAKTIRSSHPFAVK